MPRCLETISLGMSESTRDQRMTPRLAPVTLVDLTVPRAKEEASVTEKQEEGRRKVGASAWQAAVQVPRVPGRGGSGRRGGEGTGRAGDAEEGEEDQMPVWPTQKRMQ